MGTATLAVNQIQTTGSSGFKYWLHLADSNEWVPAQRLDPELLYDEWISFDELFQAVVHWSARKGYRNIV